MYLTGRDHVGWATDDDFRFTKAALETFADIVDDISAADVIHSVNWYALLPIDREILRTKRVVTHIPHDVRNMLMQPEYLKVAPFVDQWIVPSSRAKEQADLLGLKAEHIPYGIDPDVFRFLDKKRELRKKYGLPEDKYLIGSFQRDTEGRDLKTPKYVKGPDIFLAIVKKVFEKNKNTHVVLAGPRRFWLRKKLAESGIPNSFIGQDISGRDDIKENTLDRGTINELYNLIDLYVVSSRLEGGPKAILECAASRTKIISTDVGQAADVLARNQIYGDIFMAGTMILSDIERGVLGKDVLTNFENSKNHSLANISESLKKLYAAPTIKTGETGLFKTIAKKPKAFVMNRLFNRLKKKRITVYFKFHKGPWGGGNQFLKAVANELKHRGWWVSNSFDLSTPIFLFNSFLLDFDKMNGIDTSSSLMVNRIDGPTLYVRGTNKEIDDAIFALNAKVTDVSVFQSSWSLFETMKLGYRPVNPVLISNAVDRRIFNTAGKSGFDRNRKIRLISTSWSGNPRKGGPIYKWLDDHLDWSKYDYTFVGRVSEKLSHIKIVDPVPSKELAKILKQHDIYITASDNDPCSNALIEALSCGLPAIYFNRGGHGELTGAGGLPFDRREDIPNLLDIIVNNYVDFKNLIVANDIGRITERYERCFGLANNS